jgi:hypothetical protein
MEKKVNMPVVSETKKRKFKMHQGITEQQHV